MGAKGRFALIFAKRTVRIGRKHRDWQSGAVAGVGYHPKIGSPSMAQFN
jgi:hypothetical protein